MRLHHDRIIAHQKEIAKPYSESNPTEVTAVHWIYAQNAQGRYPSTTERSGKWLIFVHKSQINEVWGIVKIATESGELGETVKVSTARPNPNARNSGKHVICVYTYDSEDVGDVQRIRHVLRTLGVVQKIPYKTDRATMLGRYEVRGYRRISKYYE